MAKRWLTYVSFLRYHIQAPRAPAVAFMELGHPSAMKCLEA
jgi:hypothetical protein